jgi:hypothetical protein
VTARGMLPVVFADPKGSARPLLDVLTGVAATGVFLTAHRSDVLGCSFLATRQRESNSRVTGVVFRHCNGAGRRSLV